MIIYIYIYNWKIFSRYVFLIYEIWHTLYIKIHSQHILFFSDFFPYRRIYFHFSNVYIYICVCVCVCVCVCISVCVERERGGDNYTENYVCYFNGNPYLTIISCYSQTSAHDETDITISYNELFFLSRRIPKHNVLIIGRAIHFQIWKDGNNTFCQSTFPRRNSE